MGLSPWLARFFSSAKVFGAEFNFLNDKIEKNKIQVQENREEVQKTSAKVERQQEITNDLIRYSLGEIPYQILWRLGHPSEHPIFELRESTQRRMLNHLLDAGLIMPKTPNDYIDPDKLTDGTNVIDILKPTPAGDFLQELRGEPYGIRRQL